MATKTGSFAVLLLCLNAFFFSVVSGKSCGLPPAPKKKILPPPISSPPAITSPPIIDTCPVDAVKLGVCANLLNGLLNLQLGQPPKEPCCSLIQGLADVEAAVCLCTVIKANVLGLINLSLPINLTLLLNYCGVSPPPGFVCP